MATSAPSLPGRLPMPSVPLAAGAAGAVLVAACSAVAWRGDSALVREPGRIAESSGWTWVFLGCLAAAYAVYLAGLAAMRDREVPLAAVAVVAVALQLAPVAAPLLLSADAWVYWDYGRIAAVHGGNPYVDAPARYPFDPAYGHVPAAWRATTSVYGPAFTLASEPVALTAGGSPAAAAWISKAVAAIAVLAATACAALVARRRTFAVAFVGWNPLVAVHFGGGGHNDAVAVALLAGALALERARRPATAGAAWTTAVATKWLPLVLLPIHYLGAGSRRRLAFTAGLLGTAVVIASTASLFFGPHWLGAVGPIVGHAGAGSRYALTQRLQEAGVPHTAALAAVAVAFAVGYGWLLLEARRGRPRLALAAVLVVAASPWLLPWYAVWPVVLAAADDDGHAQLLALALCAYLLPQRVLM